MARATLVRPMALVALATLFGATLQSAAGFGFALVLAPAMFAVLDPNETVSTLLVLGAALNLLILFGEGRERSVLAPEIAGLAGWALPGLVIGAVALTLLSRGSLQVVVGALVVGAVMVQTRGRGVRLPPAEAGVRARSIDGDGIEDLPAPGARPAAGARAAAGLATGLLTTSTGTSGPPLVYWLDRVGATPEELRDTLSASFLGLNALAVAVLLLPGGAAISLDPGVLGLLIALTIVGRFFGRAIFVRLDPSRFRAIGLAVILLTGIASIAAGIVG